MGTACAKNTDPYGDVREVKNGPNKMNQKILIYGDRYESKTRAVQAMCKLARIQYELKLIDVFKNEHKSKDYTMVNPN